MRLEILVAMIKVAETLNRYKPLSQSEQKYIDGSEVLFKGDTPSFRYRRSIGRNSTGVESPNKGYMCTYEIPQSLPRSKKLRRLTEISTLINLFRRPNLRRIDVLSSGTVVDVESKLLTYADWFFKYLGNLTSACWIPPLIIPEFLMNISYVRRDLKQLGIEVKVIQKPVLIQKAMVIRSVRPQLYWTSSEVDAFRKAFDNINPVQPQSSSIIYLSRAGVASKATNIGQRRRYPNKLVASIVREIGGKVILTNQTTYDPKQIIIADSEDLN